MDKFPPMPKDGIKPHHRVSIQCKKKKTDTDFSYYENVGMKWGANWTKTPKISKTVKRLKKRYKLVEVSVD